MSIKHRLARGLVAVTLICAAGGCASRTDVRASSNSSAVSPSENPAGADTYTQVTTSARYLRLADGLPEAEGPLKFLADQARLQGEGVALTPEQAEAALAALKVATKQDVLSTLAITVAEGNTARMGCTNRVDDGSGKRTGGVTVTVGGVEQEFWMREIGVSLMVAPRVLADGSIRLDAEIQQTSFSGFIEYGGKQVALGGGTTVNVPEGFYQPVFATYSARKDITLSSGGVVACLVSAETDANFAQNSGFREKPLLGRLQSQPERWLIFLTAKTSQAKRGRSS